MKTNKYLFFKIPRKLMLHPQKTETKDVTISEISVKIRYRTNIERKLFAFKSVTSEKALKAIHSAEATKYHEVNSLPSNELSQRTCFVMDRFPKIL